MDAGPPGTKPKSARMASMSVFMEDLTHLNKWCVKSGTEGR